MLNNCGVKGVKKLTTRKIILYLLILCAAVGLTLFIVGSVQLSKNISEANAQYQQECAQYEEDYEDWYHRWWDLHTADLSERPNKPTKKFTAPPAIFFVGLGLMVVGTLASFLTYVTSPEAVARSIERQKKFEETLKAELKEKGIEADLQQRTITNKEATKVCKYCGSENPQASTKCASCGANLSSKK